ncbi:MAG: hypothetical protein COA45_09965 [Zetaproteobacteria bacterium]|nr:MAG: hypothetical protein COA45_09965 [Zetaproteobacteria bacterium]
MPKDIKTAAFSFSAVADAVKTEHPQVWDKAKKVFGHEDSKIAEWLVSSKAVLGHKTPCDVLSESDKGEEQVMDLIERIDHGYF